eukprot:gnl/TRDRNA2_/TRDRNA2_183186_c0_seq1.p1 gnl/TRDRNA2_/TRDRNA2_183186_c0~~gnl/TRDRNA2_/TRDRNA2_183186_c0_seq1.p1  ORF type:complete len:497 (+),score=93.95 gnl/TRDRNA2_/TRDRNA2_183186_c0_seq1:235-1725(+)
MAGSALAEPPPDESPNAAGNDESVYDPDRPVERDHSWGVCYCYACGLSLSITVDILQYSMPLAFLPSVLEDRGHSPMKIATAIGVYYWTGFVGGLIITSYQIWRVIKNLEEPKFTTLGIAKRHVKFLIIGLTIGSVTLICQALYPRYMVHTVCRFLQGFAGAFIFFYTFLLSVALFKGQQQVFAMTAASTALNVAEVLGSFLGAILFDLYGQRSVFWFLGVVSIINQIILMCILFHMKAEKIRDSTSTPEITPENSRDHFGTIVQAPPGPEKNGYDKLKDMLRSRRLACAVILIVMAAVVKGSVEEMLPFHADHQWGFEPLKIGQIFSVIAFAYIGAAVLTGNIWGFLHSVRVLFSAIWLALLGAAAWFVFDVHKYDHHQTTLWVALIAYGTCLGLTHTPAALLLADAIEHEEGAAKDAVNGIWNTMWEAGGSLGFLLGGLLAESYAGQLKLLMAYIFCCIGAAVLMVVVANWPSSEPDEVVKLHNKDEAEYGTSA